MLCWHATFLCPNRLAVVDEVGTSGYPSKLKRPTTVWWVVLCPLVASSLYPLDFQRTAAPLHREARARCNSHWICINPHHTLFPHSLSIRQTKTNGFRAWCLHIAYMSKSTLGVLLVCGWITCLCLRFLMCIAMQREQLALLETRIWMDATCALRMREHILE